MQNNTYLYFYNDDYFISYDCVTYIEVQKGQQSIVVHLNNAKHLGLTGSDCTTFMEGYKKFISFKQNGKVGLVNDITNGNL